MSIFRKIWNKSGESIPTQPQGDKLERAQLLLQRGEHAAAAAILEELVASQPQQAIGWYKLGNAQRALNRTDASLTSYQRAVDLDPHYGAALCNRGVALMAVGRPDDALASFERAMHADPADSIARYNFALAQIALNGIHPPNSTVNPDSATGLSLSVVSHGTSESSSGPANAIVTL